MSTKVKRLASYILDYRHNKWLVSRFLISRVLLIQKEILATESLNFCFNPSCQRSTLEMFGTRSTGANK